ncbi:hypothetical protein AWB68_03266 [Caballeronia choica]|uniref:Uncharacterized protein n=1 Tax=Caballeronia choica TaxID=326476 RepID=A0A158J037_9BURK|nr:hypothetical protein [Caballeronia choica]SAL62217.1 hypothetical protein AWB68_03266 [Caballeronia choica]
MATTKLPPGNQFDFYVPCKPAAKKFSKPAGVKPSAFVGSNFKAAAAVPFGSKGILPGTVSISNTEFAAAILECGYGRRADWKAHLALNPRERADLRSYLKARLALVLACFHMDGKCRLPRPFYKRVEQSEKVALSFILGSMGAYLAARKWLKAGDDPMKLCLHVGIYAKVSLKPERLVSFASTSKKSPDFLVEADSGDWHVFESKGGVASERWARICEGLKQLEGLPAIGWAGSPTMPVKTAVCVHTSVDIGKPLAFMAVDPPSDVQAGDEGFVLIKSAARVLQIIEAIEQFKALRADAGVQIPEQEGWTVAPTSVSMDMKIGIPNRYLRAEGSLLRAVAVFLAVREFLERERPASKCETFSDRMRRSVRLKLRASSNGEDALVVPPAWLNRKLKRLPRHRDEGLFLSECARVLRFERLLKFVEVVDTERVRITIAEGPDTLLTSAGLVLLGNSAGASTIENVQDATSRG